MDAVVTDPPNGNLTPVVKLIHLRNPHLTPILHVYKLQYPNKTLATLVADLSQFWQVERRPKVHTRHLIETKKQIAVLAK